MWEILKPAYYTTCCDLYKMQVTLLSTERDTKEKTHCGKCTSRNIKDDAKDLIEVQKNEDGRYKIRQKAKRL